MYSLLSSWIILSEEKVEFMVFPHLIRFIYLFNVTRLAQGSVVKAGTGQVTFPAGRAAGKAWHGSHSGHCQGHGQGEAGLPLRLRWKEPQIDAGRRGTWKHRCSP